MKDKIFTFLCVLCVFQQIQSFSFSLDRRFTEYCFKMEVAEDAILHGNCVISGKKEEKVKFMLYDPNHKQIDYKEKSPTYNFNINATSLPGNYSFCVARTDRERKTASFFYNIILDRSPETIDEKKAKITTLENKLETLLGTFSFISDNMNMEQGRERIHFELSEDGNALVGYCNIIQIILIMLLCVAQIYGVIIFFNNPSIRYKQGGSTISNAP